MIPRFIWWLIAAILILGIIILWVHFVHFSVH